VFLVAPLVGAAIAGLIAYTVATSPDDGEELDDDEDDDDDWDDDDELDEDGDAPKPYRLIGADDEDDDDPATAIPKEL
jgi:hypothetical protein